jgi:hypothetical protein
MKKFIFMAFFTLIIAANLSAQFTTNRWYGPYWGWDLPASTDYSSTLYRNGSISILEPYWNNGLDMKNKGFIFFDESKHWEWDNVNYGITLGNFDKFNLSLSDSYNSNNTSTVVSGYGGVAMRTMNGSMFMHQNGIVSIGLNSFSNHGAKMRELSKKEIAPWGSDLSSGFMLYVRQGIVTERVQVATMTNWPDYVFKKDYDLLPLSKVADFIAQKGHLPNTLSAETIEKEGIELGATAKNQQEKIEEIFLHLIEMEKRVKAVEAENVALKHALNNR